MKHVTLEESVDSAIEYCVGASYVADAEGRAYDGTDDVQEQLEDVLRKALALIQKLPEDHEFRR